MISIADYTTPVEPTWCPGCGDYGIWISLKKALVELNLSPHEVVLSFDIGCNSNMADKINGYVLKTLHGRAIPNAVGIKLSNPKLPVIALGGDGGTLSEGIGHLIHAARANYDITFILFNNGDYGLTKGQASCTSHKGQEVSTQPWGVVEEPLNPSHLALISKANFIARGFSGNIAQLVDLIKQGINYQGFSFIEIMQNCPTYNEVMTGDKLSDICHIISDKHNIEDWNEAFKAADISDDHIATGVLYKNPQSTTYLERLPHFKDQDRVLVNEVKKHNVSNLLESYK